MKADTLLEILKEKSRRLKDKPIVIPLTRGVAVGLLLVLLCAIAWSFYLGLMVGRGQNPQTELSEIAHMSEKDNAQSGSAVEEAGLPVKDVQEPVAAVEAGPEGRIPPKFEKPEGEQLAAWPEALTKNIDPPKPQAPSRKQQTPQAVLSKNTGSLYDFRYQVAALRTSQDAEALKTRLGKAGIRANTTKSGKVFLVTCSLRGRDADAQEFRKKIAALKLGQPLLLSKKPVDQRGGKKK